MNVVLVAFILLALMQWVGIFYLERLNSQYAKKRLQEEKGREKDIDTLQRSVEYTQAKSRLNLVETTFFTLVLIIVVLAKILPWLYDLTVQSIGLSIWADSLYLFGLMMAAVVLSLPFDWYRQFKLEERFGFNTSTQALWWSDRLKIFILSFLLFYPILLLILFLVEVAGEGWWLWTWAILVLYQLLILFLAPKLILPLFNKFTPLEDESLKESIRETAHRAGVEVESIEMMDGSKRSTHSNAYFTGFGKTKKIALFDTILNQLDPSEINAVVAHEIGHYKKRHIPKMIVWNCVILFIELWIVSILIHQDWLIQPFGFTQERFVTGILVIGLFGSLISFWLNPLEKWLSRKYEYEADGFAANLVEDAQPMINALKKLQTSNLSNPFPHPLYSFFYYSHPTVEERVKNLS